MTAKIPLYFSAEGTVRMRNSSISKSLFERLMLGKAPGARVKLIFDVAGKSTVGLDTGVYEYYPTPAEKIAARESDVEKLGPRLQAIASLALYEADGVSLKRVAEVLEGLLMEGIGIGFAEKNLLAGLEKTADGGAAYKISRLLADNWVRERKTCKLVSFAKNGKADLAGIMDGIGEAGTGLSAIMGKQVFEFIEAGLLRESDFGKERLLKMVLSESKGIGTARIARLLVIAKRGARGKQWAKDVEKIARGIDEVVGGLVQQYTGKPGGCNLIHAMSFEEFVGGAGKSVGIAARNREALARKSFTIQAKTQANTSGVIGAKKVLEEH
ncbi:hypothetical protein FJZ26_01225 [Candidatus Parvarchaeota archaeon]|nr:hypothetical protein [Candidatus Parvarchaeota archaeon]